MTSTKEVASAASTNASLDTASSAAQDAALRRALLQLIALGGSAVLASYLLAFDPAVGSRLWGGIPEGGIRDLYTVNMLLAALGFFPATHRLAFATPAHALKARTGIGFQGMFVAYAAILMASALWLPLTALQLGQRSIALWVLIRLVLLVVGGGATVLGYMLIRVARQGPPSAWLSVVAFVFFWLQTMVLDALVWPYYYSIDA